MMQLTIVQWSAAELKVWFSCPVGHLLSVPVVSCGKCRAMHEPVDEQSQDATHQSRDGPRTSLDEHQSSAFTLQNSRMPVDSDGKRDVQADEQDVEY